MPTRRVLGRYVLFQLPGWGLAALAGLAGVAWWELSETLVTVLVALWIVKDFLLFPWLRIAYEPTPEEPGSSLLGMQGVADAELAPEGYVRIGGELWRAQLRDRSARLEAGRRVRVHAVRGLTLTVDPDPDESAEPDG